VHGYEHELDWPSSADLDPMMEMYSYDEPRPDFHFVLSVFRDGIGYEERWQDGVRVGKQYMRHGELHGPYLRFHNAGTEEVALRDYYHRGERIGPCISYNLSGKVCNIMDQVQRRIVSMRYTGSKQCVVEHSYRESPNVCVIHEVPYNAHATVCLEHISRDQRNSLSVPTVKRRFYHKSARGKLCWRPYPAPNGGRTLPAPRNFMKTRGDIEVFSCGLIDAKQLAAYFAK